MFLVQTLAAMLLVVLLSVFAVNGLVLSTTSPIAKPTYRRDYVYLEKFNVFLKVNTKRKTWHEAKAYCEAEGASLAVIRTSEEAKAILDITKALPENSRDVWIGLQDLIAEGEFETIDGEPISSVFEEWGDGEPNNAGGNEDCVLFTGSGKLNDASCGTRRPFICKVLATFVTPNVPCENFDLGYKLALSGKQCIKFHKTPKTWEEAYVICTAEQAHMAVINSQEEADLYRNELSQFPASSISGNFKKDVLLLGFHDKFTEGDYVTVENQKLKDSGYTAWAPGQPDNFNNEENCGSMFRNGLLNDISCNAKAMFVCEIDLKDSDVDISVHSRIQN